MNINNRSVKTDPNFAAGVMFLFIGIIGFFIAWGYPFGSTLRMGPGYFPVVLSVLLILFGLFIIVKSMVIPSAEKIGHWPIRALIMVPLSIIIFGLLIDRVGFVISLVALIGLAATAGTGVNKLKIKKIAILVAFLVILSVSVFIYGLGLPYPLFPDFN